MIPATAVSRPAAASLVLAARAPSLGAAMMELWRTLTKDLLEPYRPERHYMRGPGPKWREKQACAATFRAGGETATAHGN